MKPSDPKGKWALYRSDLGDYMRRWILRTPWGTLRIHNILRSDEGRDFHDHPFHFASLILKGGYKEHVPTCACSDFCYACGTYPCSSKYATCTTYTAGSVVRRKATDLHRLELSKPAWTLVITSPYFRRWGFQTPHGWVDFEEYERVYE